MKKLAINAVAICIIGMGSLYLSGAPAQAKSITTNSMVATCGKACGATCGTAEIAGIEVCVCTGKCPEKR